MYKSPQIGNNFIEVIFVIKDNDMKKAFIKEALGNKNYLSYRTDLALFKILISFFAFIIIYFVYLDLVLSVLSASLIFALLTLVNKVNVDSKNEKGRKLLISKVKKTYFTSKIEEISSHDFEILIKLLFNNEGYKNIIKKGRSLYLTEKEGYIYCIKLFKLYDGIEVERLDIRSLLTFMGSSNIRQGFLITTSSLSEDAQKLLDKFKNKFDIKLIDLEGLYNLAMKYNILPEESFYYKKIHEDKSFIIKKDIRKSVKNNVLNIKKLAMYIPAAIFFYLSSIWMHENKLVIYISYYFLILTLVNIGYYFIESYLNKRKDKIAEK